MAKLSLARGYSRSAPVYDLMAGHLYVQGFLRLLPHLRVPQGAAILDVGCGTGINLLEAAHRLGPTRLLCGIDISPGMVEVARSKAAVLGVPALFTIGDAEQLPFPDATFDLVICNSVLHWFDLILDRVGVWLGAPQIRSVGPAFLGTLVGFSPISGGFWPIICGFGLIVCGFRPIICGFSPVICGFSPVICGFSPVICGFRPVICGFRPVK